MEVGYRSRKYLYLLKDRWFILIAGKSDDSNFLPLSNSPVYLSNHLPIPSHHNKARPLFVCVGGGVQVQRVSNPTAAMEVLLDLTPLDLLIMAEKRMALYCLHIPKQTAANEIAAGLLSIRKSVGDPIPELGPTTLFPSIIIPDPSMSL
jgi:hypothetical protein